MKIKLRPKTGTGIVVMLVVAVFLGAGIVPSVVGASQCSDAREKKGEVFGKGHHRPALGIWRNQQLVEQLELADGQVQQLRDADFTSRENRLDLKARLDQLRLQMDKAFSRGVSDQKAVRQLAQKTAAVKGQMFVQRIEDRLVFETILTVDQIRTLERNPKLRKRGRPGVGMQSAVKSHLAARYDGGDCRPAK